MTGNVRDNCYTHIHLLPTHPHSASVDFIRLLPVATSAHPLITHSLMMLVPEMLLSAVQFRLEIGLYTNDEYFRIRLQTYATSYETFLNLTSFDKI